MRVELYLAGKASKSRWTVLWFISDGHDVSKLVAHLVAVRNDQRTDSFCPPAVLTFTAE